MSIQELDKSKYAAWNDFVHAHEAGSFFHQAEWKEVLERAFGLKTFYFFKEEAA